MCRQPGRPATSLPPLNRRLAAMTMYASRLVGGSWWLASKRSCAFGSLLRVWPRQQAAAPPVTVQAAAAASAHTARRAPRKAALQHPPTAWPLPRIAAAFRGRWINCSSSCSALRGSWQRWQQQPGPRQHPQPHRMRRLPRRVLPSPTALGAAAPATTATIAAAATAQVQAPATSWRKALLAPVPAAVRAPSPAARLARAR